MLIGRRPKMVQNLTRDFVLNALNRLGKVHYVHVGANDGRLDDPVFKIARANRWSGVLIEPNPLYFGRLDALHKTNARMTLVNCGVSERDGTMKLYHLSAEAEPRYPAWAPGCATLDRDRLLAVLGPHSDTADADITGTPVRLRRLDAILAEHGVAATDLLVIDVEGHELSVLRSLDLTAIRPRLMVVEVNRGEDRPILDLLHRAGYAVHRIGDDLIAHSPDFPPLDIGAVMNLIGFQRLES